MHNILKNRKIFKNKFELLIIYILKQIFLGHSRLRRYIIIVWFNLTKISEFQSFVNRTIVTLSAWYLSQASHPSLLYLYIVLKSSDDVFGFGRLLGVVVAVVVVVVVVVLVIAASFIKTKLHLETFPICTFDNLFLSNFELYFFQVISLRVSLNFSTTVQTTTNYISDNKYYRLNFLNITFFTI